MKNPFEHTKAITLRDEEIISLRVDRDLELAQAVESLSDNRNNVLIYGDKGVGKTFLLRLIHHELKERKSVFPFFVRASSLYNHMVKDHLSSFSRLLLLNLCALIWKDVIDRSYIDLRKSLDESPETIALRDRPTKTVQRIYSYLMTQQKEAEHHIFNTLGFSVGIKGERKEEIMHASKQIDILPFEVIEFLEELLDQVLSPKGFERVIILCDEANNLPDVFQEEVLSRYFEMFCSSRLNFAFVAALSPFEDRIMPICFETFIKLEGFSELVDTYEFVNRANTSNLPFPEEAIPILHEQFHGHLREIMMSCKYAYEISVYHNGSTITVDHVRWGIEECVGRLDAELKAIRKYRRENSIGIGRSLTAPPSHTTVRTGPYTAIRLIRQNQTQGNTSPSESK